MRRRSALALFVSTAISAGVFAACGDDEAIVPAELDGSADGSSGDGDPGVVDAGPPTERSSCVAYITAQCQRSNECSPSPSQRNLDQCLRYNDLCPEYFFWPGSTRTIEG